VSTISISSTRPAVKYFLGFNVLVWLPYGLFCFITPGFLSEAAGVTAVTPTGSTELRAMYGGLQAGIGALCAAALVKPDLVRTALGTLSFLVVGLFSARLAGAFIDWGFSAYTGGAFAFELATLAIAISLLRAEPQPASL